MSVLHQMVPVFFVIQFVVVLVVLISAFAGAGQVFSLPRK
jgi:hypothetical protein